MGKVLVEITMSLDGFVAGPDISPAHPLGRNGEDLHKWLFNSQTETDRQLLDEVTHASGAVILGNHTYETAIDTGWEGKNPFAAPAFVVAHAAPQKVVDGFTFVTDGIESALRQAQAAAGDQQVWLMGGANLIQQYVKAGMVDELHIHIAPYLFGAGTRLFDHIGADPIQLAHISAAQTPGATHLRFRVIKR